MLVKLEAVLLLYTISDETGHDSVSRRLQLPERRANSMLQRASVIWIITYDIVRSTVTLVII